jgi:hypothetical protein
LTPSTGLLCNASLVKTLWEDAMAKTADVVIIGAGVMGASIAF